MTYHDLSNINNVPGYHVQEYSNGRILGVGGHLTVYMHPTDGDGLSGVNRWDAGRQRNELSVKLGECQGNLHKKVKYSSTVRFEQNFSWKVDGDHFFHMLQIKKWGYNRPVVTLGIKDDHVVVYRCDSYKHFKILPVKSAFYKLINTEFTVTNDYPVKISYKVHGQTGSFSCMMYNSGFTYAKLGIYRSYPNPIKTVSIVHYKDLECKHV